MNGCYFILHLEAKGIEITHHQPMQFSWLLCSTCLILLSAFEWFGIFRRPCCFFHLIFSLSLCVTHSVLSVVVGVFIALFSVVSLELHYLSFDFSDSILCYIIFWSLLFHKTRTIRILFPYNLRLFFFLHATTKYGIYITRKTSNKTQTQC